MDTIKLLDYGEILLDDSMGSDAKIVRNARVSTDKVDTVGADVFKDENLVNYLMDNRHTTPFESVVFTFYIKAPIFVFRQWHRHRTWSYNEVSARYTELPEEFYIPNVEQIGIQSATSKQARLFDPLATIDLRLVDTREKEIKWLKYACKHAFHIYHTLLEAGWPRELARTVLPFSTYSKMYATVNLHNLFHFLGLRLHSHAQYEIRVYAEAMLKLIQPVVPIAVKRFEWVRTKNEKYQEFLNQERKAERLENEK